MIFLVHAPGPLFDTQMNFLGYTLDKCYDQYKLIRLEENNHSRATPDNYPLFNKYETIIQYIGENNLLDELVCILDADMLFLKPLQLPHLNKNQIVVSEWHDHDFLYSERYKDSIDIKELETLFNHSKHWFFNTPLIGYGENIINILFDAYSIDIEIRSTFSRIWETEMLALNFTLQNYETITINMSVTNLYEEPLDNVSIIHYAKDILLNDGSLYYKDNLSENELIDTSVLPENTPLPNLILFNEFNQYQRSKNNKFLIN